MMDINAKRQSLNQKGAVWIPNVLSALEVNQIRDKITALSDSGHTGMVNFGTRTNCQFETGAVFCEYASSDFEIVKTSTLENIGSVALKLLQSKQVFFWRDELFFKSPKLDSNETPWHNGISSLPFKGMDFLSVWVSLTELNEMSSPLRTLNGSHRNVNHYRPPTGRNNVPLIDGYSEMPDLSHAKISNEDGGITEWIIKPGDAVYFYETTLHGARPNTSPEPRMAYVSRWMGDDVRWKPDIYSVKDPIANEFLDYGDPLNPKLFEFSIKA